MTEWLEKNRWLVFLAVVAAVLALLVLLQMLQPKPEPIILSTATPFPTPAATPTPRPLRVYVSGAVHRPDVYTLEPDSIVKDALAAAGGATDEADLNRVNLAQAVVDGQQIYVPSLGEENPPLQPPSAQRSQPILAVKININTAEQASLESLPGIGPALAQRILDHRQANGPFGRVEDIMDVSGIGPATFEGLQDLITTD
jgi:competence protein ComEA